MADQRSGSGWTGLPSPDEPGWSGWARHWLAVHSPAALNQQVAATGLSPLAHGRLLWRLLVDRRAALETELAQEEADGITGKALRARAEGSVEELAETCEALRILELIGPHLPGPSGKP